MDNMSWVTTWEEWREAMGPRGSRHRRAVDEFLQTHPAILYWGDSWFSTPLYRNLARQSVSRIRGMGMVIGEPGAEAAELFSAANVARMVPRLKSSPFDLLCISAGGNDCLDEHLGIVFAAWQDRTRPAPTLGAGEAYRMLLASGIFGRIREAYERLLGAVEVVREVRPRFHVVAHPYVPILKIGAPAELTTANIGLIAWLKGEVGPWLWNRMEPVLASKEEAREFADLMLMHGFKQLVLEPLAAADRYGDIFSVADFSTLQGADHEEFWHDEIHPTEEGFLKISTLFNEEIRKHLPVAKRAAVL